MDEDVYHNIIWVKFRRHFPEATEKEINSYFKLNEKSHFFCHYCGIELALEKNEPYARNPSIDHKIPKSMGGKNTFDNIAICCHRCNIVKGTLTDESFKKLLILLNPFPDWKEEIMSGLFWGRRANKLRRLNNENESVKPFKGLWEI